MQQVLQSSFPASKTSHTPSSDAEIVIKSPSEKIVAECFSTYVRLAPKCAAPSKTYIKVPTCLKIDLQSTAFVSPLNIKFSATYEYPKFWNGLVFYILAFEYNPPHPKL